MDNSEQIISSVTQLASHLAENNRLLKDQMKATGADRPNQTIAPVAPSVQAQNNQSSFTNMDDSGNKANVYKYWEVAKQVLGPLLGGNKLPDSRPEEDGVESALREQKALMEQNNLTSTKTSSMLEKVAEKETEKPPGRDALQQEKQVVKKADRVVISDLDIKATKKFGGFFKGLKGMLGLGKKKEEKVKKADGGMGILGMLGMLAVGGIALLLTPLLLPLLVGLAPLIAGIVGLVAMFKAAVAVGKLAWDGLKFAGEEIIKLGELGWEKLQDGWKWFQKTFTFDNMKKGWDRLGKFASEKWSAFQTGARNLADTVGKKFTSAVDYVKNSKIGKGVSNLMTNLSKTVSGALDSIKNSKIGKAVGGFFNKITGVFKKKPPGVDEAAAKTAAKISGNVLDATGKSVPKGSELLSMVGEKVKPAGLVGVIAGEAMGAWGAAMDEYKKSGSILSAAKEYVSTGLSKLTFGLVSQDTISGVFTTIGDGVKAAASAVSNAVSSGLGAAKGLASEAADKLSSAGKSLSEGASKVWGSIKGFFSNSPDVWDVLDESGQRLGEGAQKVNDSTKKASDNMLTMYVKNHPLAQLGRLGLNSFKSVYSKVSGWFSDSEKEVETETSKSDKTSKDLLNTQINAVHGITGNIIEVLDKQGPTVRSAAISMMECAREYFESTEAEIKSRNTTSSTTTSSFTGDSKDAIRAASINNRKDHMPFGDGISVDPETGKLRKFDGKEYGFFGDMTYRELTDDELARFDKKHNIDAISKAATPPPIKTEVPPPIQESLADKRLELPTPTVTGMASTVIAAKLTDLITVAEQQLQAIKISNEQSQQAAEQVATLVEKSKGNTVVNTNNMQSSVVNNSSGLSQYRDRLMSNT